MISSTKTNLCAWVLAFASFTVRAQQSDPSVLFMHPPESAKPGVLWMWMGSNISKEGITKDLEALKEEGFNRTTMLSLSDVTTPWANEIGKSPTPDLICWTEPWWKMVRYAAEESKRLGMSFGMFNCPGYETSGGPWITPELSMQEIVWSMQTVEGGTHIHTVLKQVHPDLTTRMPFPMYNEETELVERPKVPARGTYYGDIVVLAVPDTGVVARDKIIDLTKNMQADGSVEWEAPAGRWAIYRIGHTTMGTLLQPAPWKVTGMEVDKMSKAAVSFHMDHVVGEIQKHLGDLVGPGFNHVYFDSYEAGDPTWTPYMKEEFLQRRGYDLTPYLITFAGRTVGSRLDSLHFRRDFDSTVRDLHRDVYFTVVAAKLREANLGFSCEPYGGPWREMEVMPLIENGMGEFWTRNGRYAPYELVPTIAALRKAGHNIISAEAFTGEPTDSKWSESPTWLKSIGDAAFCAGVNRMMLHRFTEQPWDDRYKPGASMGQWGSHFDRTQTWWKPGKAMVQYWQRCQALLQWGNFADSDLVAKTAGDSLGFGFIHRREGQTDLYFLANTSRKAGAMNCRFPISGRQPELWDPVTGEQRLLPEYQDDGQHISMQIPFEASQSFFIVFRRIADGVRASGKNFPLLKEAFVLNGAWKVRFDSVWGGPNKLVTFGKLEDWTLRPEPGIKYYSGTAIYRLTFAAPAAVLKQSHGDLYLDFGDIRDIAHVYLNGQDLGVVWTAPWRVKLPAGVLKGQDNRLVIEVTNEWANRQIGDEQEPADCAWLPGHWQGRFLKEFPDWFLKKESRPSKRYCFTTWNYFNADSPLLSSGLIGPVRVLENE